MLGTAALVRTLARRLAVAPAGARAAGGRPGAGGHRRRSAPRLRAASPRRRRWRRSSSGPGSPPRTSTSWHASPATDTSTDDAAVRAARLLPCSRGAREGRPPRRRAGRSPGGRPAGHPHRRPPAPRNGPRDRLQAGVRPIAGPPGPRRARSKWRSARAKRLVERYLDRPSRGRLGPIRSLAPPHPVQRSTAGAVAAKYHPPATRWRTWSSGPRSPGDGEQRRARARAQLALRRSRGSSFRAGPASLESVEVENRHATATVVLQGAQRPRVVAARRGAGHLGLRGGPVRAGACPSAAASPSAGRGSARTRPTRSCRQHGIRAHRAHFQVVAVERLFDDRTRLTFRLPDRRGRSGVAAPDRAPLHGDGGAGAGARPRDPQRRRRSR